MAWAAGIGAAGSVIGGAAGGKGASKAADAQAQAAEKQAEVQRELGNRSIDVQIATFDEGQRKAFPWYVTGQSALSRYADAMGLARPANIDTELRPIAGLVGTSYQQGVGAQGGTGAAPGQAQPANALASNGTLALQSDGTYAPTGTAAPRINSLADVENALIQQGYIATGSQTGGDDEPSGFKNPNTGGELIPFNALPGLLGSLRVSGAQQQQQPANALAGAPNQQIPVTTEGSLPIPKDPSQLTLADFQASPDYQFRLDEGNKGVENALAARGMRLSGGALKALDRFNSNTAAGEYNAYYGRKTAERGNYLAQLANLSGLGQASVQGTNALGQSAAGNVANINQSTANGVSNALAAGGNARASGYLGQANAFGSAISGVGQAVGNYFGSQPAAPSALNRTSAGVPYFSGLY